jgi:hypothetical protein
VRPRAAAFALAIAACARADAAYVTVIEYYNTNGR